MQGAIPDLSQGEFTLQDGKLITVVGFAIGGWKGLRELGEPFAIKTLDLFLGEAVGQTLSSGGLGTLENPVVQGLELDARLGELLLEVFVTVDAKLGGIRKG